MKQNIERKASHPAAPGTSINLTSETVQGVPREPAGHWAAAMAHSTHLMLLRRNQEACDSFPSRRTSGLVGKVSSMQPAQTRLSLPGQ